MNSDGKEKRKMRNFDPRNNEHLAAEHLAGEIMQYGETAAQPGEEREFTRTSYATDSRITFSVVVTTSILEHAKRMAREFFA
jgi:hypothetical protein